MKKRRSFCSVSSLEWETQRDTALLQYGSFKRMQAKIKSKQEIWFSYTHFLYN